MIPYIESFLSQKEAKELFEFCRALPYTRKVNPRNPNSRVRKVSYACYSVLPESRTGKTVHGGGNNWLDKAPSEIKELAARLSAYRGKEINYLSILGYIDERDHIGWHNHREDSENEDQSVTVVSLGETRTLSLRPAGSRDKNFWEEFDTVHGSLYVLPSSYNATHQHAVLDDKRPRDLRISINCKSISPADLERLKQEVEIERLTLRSGSTQRHFFTDDCAEPRVWDCHKGKKYPPDAIYVGREVGSTWPNTPFGNHLRLKTQAEFRSYALNKMRDPQFAALVAGLKGRHLLCWCRPHEAANCHARVWLELANNQLPAVASTETLLHTHTGLQLARGYERVVFGDRGPYVEMKRSQMVLENIHPIADARHVYFDEFRSKDDASVMVYLQRHTVSYADYRVGFYYVSPADLLEQIIKES